MPSFDIVSEVDMHEVSNAVDQAQREISTRFDFKNSNASIEHVKDVITVTSNSDFQVDQIRSVVYGKMTKRNVNINSFQPEKIESVGMNARQKIIIRQGIDKEDAKKIIKLIKEKKLKVQAAIQEDQVRVTGKKRDDLQSVIAMLREANLDLPLQFVNFRD